MVNTAHRTESLNRYVVHLRLTELCTAATLKKQNPKNKSSTGKVVPCQLGTISFPVTKQVAAQRQEKPPRGAESLPRLTEVAKNTSITTGDRREGCFLT